MAHKVYAELRMHAFLTNRDTMQYDAKILFPGADAKVAAILHINGRPFFMILNQLSRSGFELISSTLIKHLYGGNERSHTVNHYLTVPDNLDLDELVKVLDARLENNPQSFPDEY